jgi:hypothetical protein
MSSPGNLTETGYDPSDVGIDSEGIGIASDHLAGWDVQRRADSEAGAAVD